jgi:tRNA U55 pseudouridine synthase TruB
MSEDKDYAGTLTLQCTTDTQDSEVTLEERPVPEHNESTCPAFEKFRGDFYINAAMVSAIKWVACPYSAAGLSRRANMRLVRLRC